jgi:(p)ppGpp synthase/HD superfamily hydrolase
MPFAMLMTNILTLRREISIAEIVATLGHFGQKPTADGLDFIQHPKAVASGTPLRFRAAAWMHDLLEDTSCTPNHLRAVGISEETIKIVEIVSRRSDETYEQFISRIAKSENVGAITVKLADLKHNLRPSCPESLRARYLKAVPILEAALPK